MKARLIKTVGSIAGGALLAGVLVAVAYANSVTTDQCKSRFENSPAGNSCTILWARANDQHGFWQCSMQVRCTDSDGGEVTVSTGFQYNIMSNLKYCGDGDFDYSSC